MRSSETHPVRFCTHTTNPTHPTHPTHPTRRTAGARERSRGTRVGSRRTAACRVQLCDCPREDRHHRPRRRPRASSRLRPDDAQRLTRPGPQRRSGSGGPDPLAAPVLPWGRSNYRGFRPAAQAPMCRMAYAIGFPNTADTMTRTNMNPRPSST